MRQDLRRRFHQGGEYTSRNMRKEMDELKSSIKDKGGENLDGMI